MTRTAGRVPEKVEQQHIVRLLRTLGAAVYVLGTVRKHGDHPGTMQTPGLPDVLAFLPDRQLGHSGRLVPLWVEVKAAGGRLSPAQRSFLLHCARAEQAHVAGGLDAVIAWLVGHGHLRRDQVADYRQSAAQSLESPP